MDQSLTPPETLKAPEPVKKVERNKTEELVPLDEKKVPELDARVSSFLEGLTEAELHSDAFRRKVDTVHNLGNKEIRKAASVSNRFLDRPSKALDSGLLSDSSPVANSLVELRTTVEDLDPSRQGDLLAPRRLFGIIPFGNRLRQYFMRFQSSQTQINRIIESLQRGQDELRKDNAAIEQEKVNLWQIMQALQQYIYMGKQLDASLEAYVDKIEHEEPEKARIIREELLFYVRQKVQDLLTQLSVSIQGYLALDVVRRNNLELIKGVERATTTTVSALRTAVIVAQALANQRLVLDQITALNTTTGNLIESTSKMLKRQAGQIHEQASGPTVELEKLKAAFANIYETMDMISDYKLKALGTMKETVNELSSEVQNAQKYLDRVRQEEVDAVTEELELDAVEVAEVRTGEPNTPS